MVIKLHGNRLVKFLFIIMLIVILVIFSVGVYNIFFKEVEEIQDEYFTLANTINSDKIFEITPNNYTSILQAVTENIDDYIGAKIHFTGYVYRLIDFDDTEFVLARNMIVNENSSQSLVVGFLCTYDKAYEIPDNAWIDVTGTIQKGDYYGDIAMVEVERIFQCDKPKDEFVTPPDKTYIPEKLRQSKFFSVPIFFEILI